jgi:hypothetical protein
VLLVVLPAGVEVLSELAMLDANWYVQPNDLFGGWCIMLDNRPPSAGGAMIIDCASRDIAEHVAELHNRTFEAKP